MSAEIINIEDEEQVLKEKTEKKELQEGELTEEQNLNEGE